MAGGIGSRFWPLSRAEKPKQFVDALGVGKTFIQMTYDRFARLVPKENFLVVTGEIYKELVLEQLPQLSSNQVLTEPVRRNTAPCIAYATYKLYKENPNAVVVVTPSDQYIGNEAIFESVIRRNFEYALMHDALVTIGITPSFPATGYGYIQLTNKNMDITKVAAFKEKPTLAVAQEFLKSGSYVWNSGMFIWSLRSIRDALKAYLPDISNAFDSISQVYGTQDELHFVNAAYINSRSISIDYGVMEKADNVYVCCADFGWSDVGTWGSLYQQLDKNEEDGNAISAEKVIYGNISGCLIKELDANKCVVVDGLKDYIVVDTSDVLMICPRKDEEAIKRLIEKANGQ